MKKYQQKSNQHKITFVKIGINGEAIGYDQKKPVFCMGVFPQETAFVQYEQINPTYIIARLVKIIEYSPFRTKSLSLNEEKLGNPFLSLKYPQQLEYKIELLKEALWKYGRVKDHFIRKMHASPLILGYRNQCKLPFGLEKGKLVNGLYAPGSNHFKPIRSFIMHEKTLEEVRHSILDVLNQFQLQPYDMKSQMGLRYLVLRHYDGLVQATLITGKDILPQECINKLLEIPSLYSFHHSNNTEKKSLDIFGKQIKTIFGPERLPYHYQNLTIQYSPKAFSQRNTLQQEALYQLAIDKIDPCQTLVEAYCGVGTMALCASHKAQNVYGIEEVASAIEDAKLNAKLNQIENVHFIAMDAANGLYKVASKTTIDCLLVDPPRSGLDDAMIEAILKIQPQKIIYISCNPSTLAKNLKQLKQQYLVQTIVPFDLFPQTPHVESITVLTK